MKFSITIPAYKQKYLAEAIDSCLAQTCQDFELIIVNDHSPENLDDVVSLYDDPRIRYYVNEKNCGAADVVDNWNICLSYANGEFIICMGDDDKLLPCCLEEYAKLMEQYPGLSVYHAWTELINENSQLFMFQEQRPQYESAYAFLWHRWTFRHWQFIGDFLYDTKRLREQGGFYKLPLAWTSDDITAFRAALDGGIANTQKPCFQYRSNSQTISNNGSHQAKLEATLFAKNWYEEILPTLNPENDTDRQFLDLLRKRVAQQFRNRFLTTLREGYPETIKDYRYWLQQAPKFGLTKRNILREYYNYFIKKFLHIREI